MITVTFPALKQPIRYRDYGHDGYIVKRVAEENMYRLPEDMTGKFVLDIGAHVGAFSCLAASRGAFVVGFEPESENYALFSDNASAYTGLKTYRVDAHHFAVVGEPRDELRRIAPRSLVMDVVLYVHPENTGCNSIDCPEWKKEIAEDVQCVRAITLFQIFDAYRILHHKDLRCAFLKMDCEGSEEGILNDLVDPSLPLLEKVDEMAVEFHSMASVDRWIPVLEEKGFYAAPIATKEWRFRKKG